MCSIEAALALKLDIVLQDHLVFESFMHFSAPGVIVLQVSDLWEYSNNRTLILVSTIRLRNLSLCGKCGPRHRITTSQDAFHDPMQVTRDSRPQTGT